MKERSKLVRAKKNKTSHKVSLKLADEPDPEEEMKIDHSNVNQRRKEDGKIQTMQTMLGKTPAKP
jgi:hypothetical protein